MCGAEMVAEWPMGWGLSAYGFEEDEDERKEEEGERTGLGM